MEYEVRELNIHDNSMLEKVAELYNLTFGLTISIQKLKLNTVTNSQHSLYLGSFKNGVLVGFNVFIAHDFCYQNKRVEAFQSGWSATHPDHRGKGIFFELISTAKEILKARKAAFIFGFPNANSHPIFTKKLGFYEIPLCKVQLPTLFPGTKNLLKVLEKDFVFSTFSSFVTLESQVIDLKKQEYGDAIKVYSTYNNTIWGKKRWKKVAGFSIPYFSVGGLIVNKPHLLSLVLKEMIQSEKVYYIEIVGAATNSYFQFFRHVKPAPNTEPLIVFNLNEQTNQQTKFVIFTGIKDVF
jgi:predicted N-acetyltransferase YhbS